VVDENRLEILQDEIKLLKGELKNSLASVRDYLLNMELPSSEFSTILAALNGDSPTTGKLATEDGAKVDEIPEPNLEAPDEEMGEEIEQPPEDEQLLDFEKPKDDEEPSQDFGDSQPLEDLMGDKTNPEDTVTEEELLPEGEEALPVEEALESEEAIEEPGEEEEEEEEITEDLLDEDEELEEEDLDLEEEEGLPEPELPLDEGALAEAAGNDKGIPKVNMLANLVNWVARAKQEIGYEQLPSFLEVYGISGHLSPELKDVILRLAEVSRDLPDNIADSEIWSQSMLSLHGILTGGEAPLNPVIPAWVDAGNGAESLEDEIIEIDKAKDKAATLKLVFPDGDGKSKEFCINLSPEENGNGAK
jgi:hypothetical protein